MLKRIETAFNNLPDFLRDGDPDSDKFKADLRAFKTIARDGVSQEEYVYNLEEYPTGIKKLFIKGGSKRNVPRQVLNIVTHSFTTNPEEFLKRFDGIEFKEFTDDKLVIRPSIQQAIKHRTEQVQKQRDRDKLEVELREEIKQEIATAAGGIG